MKKLIAGFVLASSMALAGAAVAQAPLTLTDMDQVTAGSARGGSFNFSNRVSSDIRKDVYVRVDIKGVDAKADAGADGASWNGNGVQTFTGTYTDVYQKGYYNEATSTSVSSSSIGYRRGY